MLNIQTVKNELHEIAHKSRGNHREEELNKIKRKHRQLREKKKNCINMSVCHGKNVTPRKKNWTL